MNNKEIIYPKEFIANKGILYFYIFGALLFLTLIGGCIYFAIVEKNYLWLFGICFGAFMTILDILVILNRPKKLIFFQDYIELIEISGKKIKIICNDIISIEKIVSPQLSVLVIIDNKNNKIELTADYQNMDELLNHYLPPLIIEHEEKNIQEITKKKDFIICQYSKQVKIANIIFMLLAVLMTIFIIYSLMTNQEQLWAIRIILVFCIFIDIFFFHSIYTSFRKYIFNNSFLLVKNIFSERKYSWTQFKDVEYKYLQMGNISSIILHCIGGEKIKIGFNLLSNSSKLLAILKLNIIYDKEKSVIRDVKQWTKEAKKQIGISFIILIGLSLLLIITTVIEIKKKIIEQKIIKSGVETYGRVTSKKETKNNYYLYYSYQINNKKYKNRSSVDQIMYNDLSVDSSVKIIYLTNNHNISEIKGFWETSYVQIVFFISGIIFFMYLCFQRIKQHKQLNRLKEK